MPLRAADFESAAYAIPPLRAGPKCRRRQGSGSALKAADRARPGRQNAVMWSARRTMACRLR